MNRRLIATALVGLALASGCSDIESGTIVRKSIEPERDYTTTRQDCVRYNKNHTCAQYRPVVTKHHDDQDFVFHLKKGDDTGEVDVSRKTYDSYEVGQTYP